MNLPYIQKCHELHTRGPCGEDETFVYSPPEERPFCIYTLCKHPEMALHDDGRCYFLGERGPCGEAEELRLDERTKMPLCQPVVKVKSMCDADDQMSQNSVKTKAAYLDCWAVLETTSTLF